MMSNMTGGRLLALFVGMCLSISSAEAAREGMALQQERNFLMTAAVSQEAEIALGRIATERAESEKVKQFAQRMIDNHTKAGQEVNKLASAVGVSLPEGPTATQQKTTSTLSKLSGKEFDRAYVEHELKDHRKNVAQFKAHAKTLKDPQVRQWVSGTLPVLKEHVLIAKSIAADLKSGTKKRRDDR